MATTATPTNEIETPAATPAEAASKKTRVRVIALGLLALGGVGVLTWYTMHAGLESTDDAQIDADVVAVPAQLAGTVRAVHFVDNQPVKAGDILVEIDPASAKARLAEAEAQVAADNAAADAFDQEALVIEATASGQKSVAEATLRGSSVAATATADEIAQADAQVKSASIARDQAKVDMDRVKQLFAQGAIPRQQLDDAQMRLDGAESSLIAAKAHQSVVRASQVQAQSRVAEASGRVRQSGTVAQQIAQARARAAEAHAKAKTSEAARDLAAIDVDHTTIRAPREGLASKKGVVIGQMLGLGQPVTQIVPTKDVWVTANFKETQLAKMRLGQPVDVEIDAYPGMKLKGTVQSFSGATGARFSLLPPENATGNFTKVVQRIPVRIKLEDGAPDDRTLRPGMSAEITVDTRK